MKIEIDYEIGDMVWFIHPKTLKAVQAVLLGIKIHATKGDVKIKYHVDAKMLTTTTEETYTWNVCKTRESLLKTL